MSFILDALKKSEADRQQQTSGEFSSIPTAVDNPGPPRWIWVLGALLLVNIVVLVALATRNDNADGLAAIPNEPAAEAPQPAAVPEQRFADRLRESEPAPRPAPAVRDEPPPSVPPASANVEAPAAVQPAVRSAPVANSSEALPTLTEIRLNDGVQLPDMNLDIHVYGESAADRFVFIDMQKLGEGDTAATGARLEEITPGGVVMSYRGTRFVLPRE